MENNYFEEFEEMEAEKGMTVIACYPGKTAQVVEIDGSLEGMQKFVGGGYIEPIYPFSDPVAIVCNEEGKINRMELNRALYTEDGTMFDIVAGPMFICGLGEEDFTSLQGELLEKYMVRRSDMSMMLQCDCFKTGFRLGAQFMLEVCNEP